MSETLTRSDDISALALALNEFQASLPSVEKDATNPFFGSRYATLHACMQAVKEPMTAQGLSIAQFPTSKGLISYLLHTSGQWIAHEMELFTQGTPQGQGSAITYARRYALCAILGLVADDDDDGNAAQQSAPPQQRQQAPQRQNAPRPQQNGQRQNGGGGGRKITEKQSKALYAISRQMNFGLTEFIERHMGKRERDLTAQEASDLIDGLNNGSIDPQTPTVGAQQVADSFGAVVQDPEESVEGYGFSQEKF